MELHGANVVVSGGSNGIGLALAKGLSDAGASVWNLDVVGTEKNIPNVTHLSCDISNSDEVCRAFAQINGAIDLLILNAGVIRRGQTLSHAQDEFDTLFAVNAKGVWLMLKEAAALLAPHATILHVSSYRALQSPDDPGLYAASKAAGEHITRCAATGHPGWNLKIARLGPFETGMAREGSPVRPTSEAASLLLRLATSAYASLSYDPNADEYAFVA